MTVWPAEIGQHTVTHVSGNEAVVPDNDGCADILIAADQMTVVFRIEPSGQRRRPGKIAEHDGQLTPVRLRRHSRDDASNRRCRSCRLRRWRRTQCRGLEGGDTPKQPLAVAEGADTKLLQVLVL